CARRGYDPYYAMDYW
nr:immunoglobulin heavy chain junction region [Mus musculus]MBK4197210.1 immunoglobulin heavy chain junction region [Mus musculus]